MLITNIEQAMRVEFWVPFYTTQIKVWNLNPGTETGYI